MLKKFAIFSIVFLLLGATFLILENIFYQYLDENGVLHESMFLPLGVFCLIVGILGVFAWFCIKVFATFFASKR